MERRKRTYVLSAAFLVLLLAGGLFISQKLQDGADNSLYVFTCRPYGNTFTQKGIDQLSEAGFLNGYSSEGRLRAETYRAEKTVRAVGTDEDYPYLAGRRMKEGAWFNGLHVKRQSRTVVLNEAAAKEFFGTVHALSNHIYLDGMDYLVIGVVCEDTQTAGIYLPYGSLVKYHGWQDSITQVFSCLESASKADLLLQLTGMAEEEVEIFQMSEYQKTAAVRFQVLIFIFGIVLVMRLVKGVVKEMRWLAGTVNVFAEKNYLSEGWRLGRNRQVWISLLSAAAEGLAAVLLFLAVCFEPILPSAGWMSGREGIWEHLKGVVCCYMQTEIRIQEFAWFQEWNLLSLALFFISVPVGFFVWKDLRRIQKTDGSGQE